jgi:tRNA (cytidine32/uridine32-2'-O)-methyltransferase
LALDDIRIVLIEPAHPGNIGAVARAMKTMSFSRLVLVRPHRFPSEEADRRAMGSIEILQAAEVVDDLDRAVDDCRLVIGCSARPRSFRHSELDPKQCASQLARETASGDPAALVFGPERMGLANHDLDRCTHQLLIPTNEAFSSLNLASAVQLICYEVFLAGRAPVLGKPIDPDERPSGHREMEYFFDHLERALDSRGYLDGEMREVTMTKLRRLFGRSRPDPGELKILRTLMRLIHRDGE